MQLRLFPILFLIFLPFLACQNRPAQAITPTPPEKSPTPPPASEAPQARPDSAPEQEPLIPTTTAQESVVDTENPLVTTQTVTEPATQTIPQKNVIRKAALKKSSTDVNTSSTHESSTDKAAESTDTTLDQYLASLHKASIAYSAPETLSLDTSAIIHLRLSRSMTQATLAQSMDDKGVVKTDTFSVSETVSATLKGLDFEITSLDQNPEQMVFSSGAVDWRWQIKPKSSGSHNLVLTVSALVKIHGTERSNTIYFSNKSIEVLVAETSVKTQITSFIGNNWEWCWSAILVPVAGFLWNKRKKKTGKATEEG